MRWACWTICCMYTSIKKSKPPLFPLIPMPTTITLTNTPPIHNNPHHLKAEKSLSRLSLPTPYTHAQKLINEPRPKGKKKASTK